jgi:predicted PurR-regulated permease PerM
MIASRFFTQATYFLLFVISTMFLLVQAESVFIPFTFSVIFAFIALPLSIRMENMKFPSWLAAFVSVVFIALIVGGLITFLSVQVSQFSDDVPMIKVKLNERTLELQQYIRKQSGYTIKEQNKWLDEQMNSTENSTGSYIMSFFSATTGFIANATLIPIMVFFMLLYRNRFKTFLTLIDTHYHFHTFAVIREIGKVSQLYLRGLFIDVLILTILNAIGFVILGVEHAILFALLAAILNIIPYIGVILGGLFPVMMVLVTQDNSWIALGVLGVTVVVQFLDNNFIYPKVVGSSVSVNPLVSILALIIGNLIWGTAGMILALPLTGMLKVVMDNIKCTRPYGFLMGEEETCEPKSVNFNKEGIGALRHLVQMRGQGLQEENEPSGFPHL